MAKLGIDQGKRWYVVRTNVRSERKAADNLRKAGFDHYLPTQRIEKHNKRSHTYRMTERPLMTGYLFVGLPAHSQHFGLVRGCQGVEDILKVRFGPGPEDFRPLCVPANAVEEIYLAEFDMQFDDTREARIHRKEEARTRKATVAMTFPATSEWLVSDGPFASFNAVVESVTSAGMVKALVSIFGRSTVVEFEPKQLSPFKRAKAA